MSSEPETSGRDYFEAVEEEFIRLRGALLLLSPADWRLTDSWRQEGVPLFLVLESLREVFRRRAERRQAAPDATQKRVSSLRYCRAEVEKAWARHRELGGAVTVRSRPAPMDVPARLRSLAEALPARLAAREDWQRQLLGLSGPPSEVERRLADLDRELVDQVFESLTAEAKGQVSAQAEAAVNRLPAERQPGLERRMVRRIVRDRCRLPLLSLFAEPARRQQRG